MPKTTPSTDQPPIDYSETTWSDYKQCWTDEHGAAVSGPPMDLLIRCWNMYGREYLKKYGE